jgi:hypothetical protein
MTLSDTPLLRHIAAFALFFDITRRFAAIISWFRHLCHAAAFRLRLPRRHTLS